MKRRSERRRKKLLRDGITSTLLVLCLGMAGFAGWRLWDISQSYKIGDKSYEALSSAYVQPLPQKQQTEETISPMELEGEHIVETASAQEEEIPFTIAFEALRRDNSNVVGWLWCEDTPIHYPVMQSRDNEYYLRRLPDGRYNINGSIFMDYRNRSDMTDWNTLLYGHNMKTDAMFGTLDRYREQKYYELHPSIILLTPDNNWKLELIAGCYVDSNARIYAVHIPEEEREAVIEDLVDASLFQTKAERTPADRYVTLSTCTDDDDSQRFILIGILREAGAEMDPSIEKG